MRKSLLFTIICLISVMLLAGCGGNKEAATPSDAPEPAQEAAEDQAASTAPPAPETSKPEETEEAEPEPETNDEEANAQRKLEKKNLDFIVLNSLQNKGTCFRSDENQISIISRTGQQDYERKPKQEVAADIIDRLAELL